MLLGIDTASVAGNKVINWGAARAAGCSFAILRSNWGIRVDTLFLREWDKVREAGIVRGAYMFLRFPHPKTKLADGVAQDPVAQAEAMCLNLELSPGDLPPSLDVEFPGDGRRATGLPAEVCHGRVLQAYSILRAHYECDPIIYTSARVWREDLDNMSSPMLASCPLWLARYPFKPGPAKVGATLQGLPAPPVPPPWGDADNYWLHQYQGDATGFPGFTTGNVDMNRLNPMVKGAVGERVKWVQRHLCIPVNGRFDIVMDGSLRLFQRQRGLVADGVIGPRTFACLARQYV